MRLTGLRVTLLLIQMSLGGLVRLPSCPLIVFSFTFFVTLVELLARSCGQTVEIENALVYEDDQNSSPAVSALVYEVDVWRCS